MPSGLQGRDLLEQSSLFVGASTTPGRVLEAAVGLQWDPGDALGTEVALAYGSSSNSEVALTWNPIGFNKVESNRKKNARSLGIDWLTRFKDESALSPACALGLNASIPLSRRESEPDPWLLGLELLASQELSFGILSATLAAGAVLPFGESPSAARLEPHSGLHLASYLGRGLGGFVSIIDSYDAGDSQNSGEFSFGLAQAIASQWTLDMGLRSGLGQSEVSREFFWGLSVRF